MKTQSFLYILYTSVKGERKNISEGEWCRRVENLDKVMPKVRSGVFRPEGRKVLGADREILSTQVKDFGGWGLWSGRRMAEYQTSLVN